MLSLESYAPLNLRSLTGNSSSLHNPTYSNYKLWIKNSITESILSGYCLT